MNSDKDRTSNCDIVCGRTLCKLREFGIGFVLEPIDWIEYPTSKIVRDQEHLSIIDYNIPKSCDIVEGLLLDIDLKKFVKAEYLLNGMVQSTVRNGNKLNISMFNNELYFFDKGTLYLSATLYTTQTVRIYYHGNYTKHIKLYMLGRMLHNDERIRISLSNDLSPITIKQEPCLDCKTLDIVNTLSYKDRTLISDSIPNLHKDRYCLSKRSIDKYTYQATYSLKNSRRSYHVPHIYNRLVSITIYIEPSNYNKLVATNIYIDLYKELSFALVIDGTVAIDSSFMEMNGKDFWINISKLKNSTIEYVLSTDVDKNANIQVLFEYDTEVDDRDQVPLIKKSKDPNVPDTKYMFEYIDGKCKLNVLE